MNKRSVAKAFNEAEKGKWTVITTKEIKLTNGFFKHSEESEEEINIHIRTYIDTFLTKAVQKKIVGLTANIHWPYDGVPFRPYVDKIKVFRLGSKYVAVINVNHLAD